jgi:hypothetical protein
MAMIISEKVVVTIGIHLNGESITGNGTCGITILMSIQISLLVPAHFFRVNREQENNFSGEDSQNIFIEKKCAPWVRLLPCF